MFREAVCKRCGKTFITTYNWAYKECGKYYCSFPCYNHRKDTQPQDEVTKPLRKNKPVEQYSKGGDLIAVYPSAKLAAEALNIEADGIREACRGEKKLYKGFLWQYQ